MSDLPRQKTTTKSLTLSLWARYLLGGTCLCSKYVYFCSPWPVLCSYLLHFVLHHGGGGGEGCLPRDKHLCITMLTETMEFDGPLGVGVIWVWVHVTCV